ncbi:MAG: hypothetical protein ABS45_16755 [Comamonas sp. SCN 65-56]|nr:MAG: hypothetical protein ABS45_16755 [Comamonas sp. SCN 65-56]
MPCSRHHKRSFVICNLWQWHIAPDLAFRNKLTFLGTNSVEQLACRLVALILRNKQTADGKLQDGLFEGVDGFGAVEQQVEVGGDALPVFGQFFGGCAGGEHVEQRGDQPCMLLVLQPAVRFQRVAKLHQLLDTRDDAGLFGEGW